MPQQKKEQEMNESFIESVKKLYKRYPNYRTLFNRVIKKLEEGDRKGAIKTLNTSLGISLCGGNPDIKADIYKVLREEQKK